MISTIIPIIINSGIAMMVLIFEITEKGHGRDKIYVAVNKLE
jgi:hypothetical protein